ncbi:conserved hypothetical protein [Arsukibacterium tuosuense]|uniref:ABC transporter substrate-binding protein n=1 Tax=Arsukibacterium tuosuense TaxID=1323745 RepID=A0A285I2Q8_9GAMM|nr:ABC transporter substrate-binding protein [Arsukibacterium tuosuense]SNY42239.1 conserved hypothetical protein [Arsukibacterium tuosuense]
MRLLFRRPAAILLLLYSASLTAQQHSRTGVLAATQDNTVENTPIHWTINDAPPFHVLHGEYQRQGICDVLTRVVHRYLPAQQASYLQMPQPRIAQALDNKEPVCFPCMIYKPAGEPRAVYSLPTHVYYPHHIITSETTARTLRALYGEPILLEKLLDDSRFRLGYPAGRRYGILQPLLNEHDPYLARAGAGGAVAILHMISSGRLDYTIDYPIVANYFQRLYNRSMVTLEITENHQQPVAGAIGCANTDWGKSKIAEINRVIKQIRTDPELSEVLQLWHSNGLNNSNDYDYFNQQWLQVFDGGKARQQ